MVFLDNQPALSSEHGVALDSLMFGEVNRNIARQRKAAGRKAPWFQQKPELQRADPHPYPILDSTVHASFDFSASAISGRSARS